MLSVMTVIPQMWSLGVLLWVMVYGANPFDNVVAAEECILKFPQEGNISEVSSSLQGGVGLWLDHIHTVAYGPKDRDFSALLAWRKGKVKTRQEG